MAQQPASTPPPSSRPSTTTATQPAAKSQQLSAGQKNGDSLGRQSDWPRSAFRVKVIGLTPQKIDVQPKPSADSKDGAKQEQPAAKGQTVTGAVVAVLEFSEVNAALFREKTKLADVRAKLAQINQKVPPYKFCNEHCMSADETATLGTYISTLVTQPKPEDTEVRVFICAGDGPQNGGSAAILSKPPYIIKFLRVLEETNQVSITGSMQSSAFGGKDASLLSLKDMRQTIQMSRNEAQDTFCLGDGTSIKDAMLLGDYLNLINEPLDPSEKIPSIRVYFRKAGSSQPRSKESLLGNGAAKKSEYVHVDAPKLDLSFTDRSASELKRDKTGFKVEEQLNARDISAKSADPRVATSKMTEEDWACVLSNSNALYGWKFDLATSRIVRAPHPAFRLRAGLNMIQEEVEDVPPVPEQPIAAAPPVQTPAVLADGTAATTKAEEAKPLEAPKLKHLKNWVIPKANAIPSYSINDNSKIDVAVAEHEFQQSMAENHFSGTTFEASASGSFKGVGVGASAGTNSSNESGQTSSDKTFARTMVGTYHFPRVTLFFPSEDLEPTPEFAAALKKVQETKNINDLRKIKILFGHIFCQRIVLGGCLQTSKTVTGRTRSEETMQRNKFKAEIGVNVSVPGIASGGFKTSREKQDHKEQGQTQTDTQEHMSFNATGGNTILAADPAAWSSSVADFNFWRVIEQSDLRPLTDLIAEIPGYEEVRMWYLQAVPKLSEYLVVPHSRNLDMRLKVMFKTEGLKRIAAKDTVGYGNSTKSENEDIGISRSAEGRDLHTYLGHNPAKAPKPIRISFEPITRKAFEGMAENMKRFGNVWSGDMTNFQVTVTQTTTEALFTPPSTQAPALFSPSGSTVGTQNDNNRNTTLWRFEVPSGFSLAHESLVIVKSLAHGVPDPLKEEKSYSLVVYRNAQGVFLPSISNAEEPCFWRVLRTRAPSLEDPKPALVDGDEIRLCWRFSDQVSGFRDYVDDIYGRRRYNKPSDVQSDSLYLKVPFPRFEPAGSDTGIGLVMSQCALNDPVFEELTINDDSQTTKRSKVNYNLFDLSFRLDSVGNNGMGDALDYMNVHTTAIERTTPGLTDQEKAVLSKMEDMQRVHEAQVAFDAQVKRGFEFLGAKVDVSPGSPVDIAARVFTTTVSNIPIVSTVRKVLGFFGL